MNRKKKIIYITVLFIVLVSIIGFTYAYIGTKILGNSNSKKMSFTSKKVSVTYKEISNTSSGETISPGYEYLKIFTATNTGNVEVKYHIYLDEVENDFIRVEDITYTLYRKSGNNTITSSNLSSAEIVSSGMFPIVNQYIKTNEVLTNSNDVYTYALKINYNTSTESQDSDSGHVFGFKVQLHTEIVNPYQEDTLAYTLLQNIKSPKNDESTIFGKEVETFTEISNENERVLNYALDDYGVSYYYRGNVLDNYVSFAGFTWRIMRINGDGTVRIILDGTLDRVKRDGVSDYAGVLSAFNIKYNDNAYVGYMYGNAGSSDYDSTHKNLFDSTIKEKVDSFYENYIENDTKNYHYEKYLADTLFCGDKTISNNYGYGTNSTRYKAKERLWDVDDVKATLECAKGASDTYSRYTKESTKTSRNVSLNNDLKYSIGLISADELVMAGAFKGVNNLSFYLANAYAENKACNHFWTSTPVLYASYDDINQADNFLNTVVNYSLNYTGVQSSIYGVRPVINLKADLKFISGDGTKENAYTLYN